MRIAPQHRTARKHYQCDEFYTDCRIAPGDRYWRLVLVPWEDVNTSDQWWQLRLCDDHYYPPGMKA